MCSDIHLICSTDIGSFIRSALLQSEHSHNIAEHYKPTMNSLPESVWGLIELSLFSFSFLISICNVDIVFEECLCNRRLFLIIILVYIF